MSDCTPDKMSEFEKLVKNQLRQRKIIESQQNNDEQKVTEITEDPRMAQLERYLQTLPTGEEYREALREISGLREFCTSQSSTIVRLNMRIEEIMKDNKQMSTEIKTLTTQNDNLESKLSEVQNKPTKDINSVTQRENSRLKSENEKLKKQIERIKTNLKTAESNNSIKTEELESRLKFEVSTIEVLHNKVSDLTEKLDSTRKTMREMAAKQSDLMDENCFLTEQLRKFQLSTTRRIHSEDQKTIKQIETCFQQLKSTVTFYSKIFTKNTGNTNDQEKTQNLMDFDALCLENTSLGKIEVMEGLCYDSSYFPSEVPIGGTLDLTEDQSSNNYTDLLHNLQREIKLIGQKASSLTAERMSDNLSCPTQ